MDIKKINLFFKKNATKAVVDDILSKIYLSDRQEKIFEMFYLKRQNIGYIADTLNCSASVISVELNAIRCKINAIIQ